MNRLIWLFVFTALAIARMAFSGPKPITQSENFKPASIFAPATRRVLGL